MTGFEVVGVILGVVPLVLAAFDRIQRLRNMDRDFKVVHRNTLIAQGQFKLYIKTLLLDALDEERGDRMLRYPDSDDWKLENFDQTQLATLELAFDPVRLCIEGFQDAMTKYEEEIQKLAMQTEAPLGNIIAPSLTPVQVAIPAFQTRPILPVVQRFLQRIKPRAKNPCQSLVLIYETMEKYNNHLRGVIACRTQARVTQTNRAINMTSRPSERQMAPCSSSSGRPCQNPVAIQLASQSLHDILHNSPTVHCSCHLLHLRLDHKIDAISMVDQMQFAFLMTGSLKCVSTPDECILPLVFTSNDGKTCGAQMTDNLNQSPTLCKELLPNNRQYERYFPALSGKSGFVLRRSAPLDPSGTRMASLAQLLDGLKVGDCYEIATSLTSSILSHYSSPWLRDWTVDSIRFIENHHNESAMWTPHVVVEFWGPTDRRHFCNKNSEVYLLGLILLELGRRKRLEYMPSEQPDVTLQRALSELPNMVGIMYKRVVENCLMRGRDTTIDLMNIKDMEEFQKDTVHVLERLISTFRYGSP